MRNLNNQEIINILTSLNSGGQTNWTDSGVTLALPTAEVGDSVNIKLEQTVIARMFIHPSGQAKFFIIRAITGE